MEDPCSGVGVSFKPECYVENMMAAVPRGLAKGGEEEIGKFIKNV